MRQIFKKFSYLNKVLVCLLLVTLLINNDLLVISKQMRLPSISYLNCISPPTWLKLGYFQSKEILVLSKVCDSEDLGLEQSIQMFVNGNAHLCNEATFLKFLEILSEAPWQDQLRFIQVLDAVYDKRLSRGRSFIFKAWDIIEGFFGVWDGTRVRARQALSAYFDLEDFNPLKEEMTRNLIRALRHNEYPKSGKNRYAPLAVFVANLLKRKSRIHEEVLSQNSELAKLLASNLLYNPRAKDRSVSYDDVEDLYIPMLPLLSTGFFVPGEMTQTEYSWFELGSSPSAEGAQQSFVIKDVLETQGIELDVTGMYRSFPHYSFNPGTGEFFRMFGDIHEGATESGVEDVRYIAKSDEDPVTDIMSDEFEVRRTYDFVSACKEMHHCFKPGEKFKPRPMAERVRGTNAEINWIGVRRNTLEAPEYYLSETQVTVIENLMSSVKPGGYLFLDLCMVGGSWKKLESKNDDVFLIIRRVDNNTFQIYDQVIPYDTDHDKVYPKSEVLIGDRSLAPV